MHDEITLTHSYRHARTDMPNLDLDQIVYFYTSIYSCTVNGEAQGAGGEEQRGRYIMNQVVTPGHFCCHAIPGGRFVAPWELKYTQMFGGIH